MRKEGISVKNALVRALPALLFFLVPLVFTGKANAYDACAESYSFQYGLQQSCTNKEAFPQVSLGRTATDIPNIVSTEFLSTTWANSSQDERGTCGSCIMLKNVEDLGLDPKTERGGMLSAYTDEEITVLQNVCQDLDCDYNNTALGAKANGSILGVTKFASNTVLSEPIPVNLAYYVKHNVRKIPVINQTAYAQTASYNAMGLEFVLGVWEKTRNVAYAMMAVIMLVIGIMITAQKRINPQTVVTVQSAIPRVVISLFLITFSYPIGAILASLVMPLMLMSIGFFVNAYVENFANMDWLVAITTFVTQLLGPQGLLGIFTGTLIGLLIVVVMLIALVKLLLVQLKILIQIVVAPIQFAISAVPGQEHLVTDWFKGMIAKVLGVPAIMFMIALSWFWPREFMTNPHNFSGIVTGSGPFVAGFSFLRASVSYAFTTMMIPILQIMTLFMAVKADKAVEGFILGGDNKKRR